MVCYRRYNELIKLTFKQSLWYGCINGYNHCIIRYKGKRFACQIEYMIHQPMGGTGGGTQQTDMAIAAEHLLKTSKLGTNFG